MVGNQHFHPFKNGWALGFQVGLIFLGALSLWGYVGCWHNDLPGPCRSLRGVHPAPSSAGGSWFTKGNLEDLWEKQKKTSLAPVIISCVIFVGGEGLFFFGGGRGVVVFVVRFREGIPWVLGEINIEIRWWIQIFLIFTPIWGNDPI